MGRSVLEYLEASRLRNPDKCAVADERENLSYGQLFFRSRGVGTALAAKIAPGEPVGVYLEKGVPAITAFFGAVYAGGFYSVLNPELPDARLSQIAGVLEPRVIVTDAAGLDRAARIFPGFDLVTVEELSCAEADDRVLEARRRAAVDTDPLYVNFTSGSTGTPKGIAVCHRSVLDFIGCFTELFSITEADVVANQAPFDFDVSVKDIYSAMKVGATLLIVPRRLFSAPAALVDFLCDHGATTMIWAVSALCLMSTFHALDYRVPAAVNKILFSGEVMPAKALADFRRHLPGAMFVNLYGPTEITCNCTYHILNPERDYAAGIPIGIPFPNEDVFLLDGENRKITEPETVGELCVRGTALALGYYRNPEQNAAHFVQNPLNPNYPERIYRTGDLARYDEAGLLVFSGRKDFQIKYMGHRIELEEIEREMAAIDGVERCCCLFDEKRSRLKGFYVGTVEKETLHAAMRRKLPEYMIPGILRQVEAMPLTKNGKIDRKALAELTGGRRG